MVSPSNFEYALYCPAKLCGFDDAFAESLEDHCHRRGPWVLVAQRPFGSEFCFAELGDQVLY